MLFLMAAIEFMCRLKTHASTPVYFVFSTSPQQVLLNPFYELRSQCLLCGKMTFPTASRETDVPRTWQS